MRFQPKIPMTREYAVHEIKGLLNIMLWDRPELQVQMFEELPRLYPQRYVEFMTHFEAFLKEVDEADNWEEATVGASWSLDPEDPMDAIRKFRVRWDFAASFGTGLPWPIPEYQGERLQRRKASWECWYEKYQSNQKPMPPELKARVEATIAEGNRPKTYYERLYEGVQYDPYTGELVAVPEGSVELEDGSWLIPDVPPDPPEEAFGKNGERLEPYSKEWNAYMRAKYFNWPLDHDESGPTCSLAFYR